MNMGRLLIDALIFIAGVLLGPWVKGLMSGGARA
jgi:hypothetical protein